MHTEVFRHYEGCRSNKLNQMSHLYCSKLDLRTRAEYCFDVVFAKVDIFLANESYFEIVDPTILIPVYWYWSVYNSREIVKKLRIDGKFA